MTFCDIYEICELQYRWSDALAYTEAQDAHIIFNDFKM